MTGAQLLEVEMVPRNPFEEDCEGEGQGMARDEPSRGHISQGLAIGDRIGIRVQRWNSCAECGQWHCRQCYYGSMAGCVADACGVSVRTQQEEWRTPLTCCDGVGCVVAWHGIISECAH